MTLTTPQQQLKAKRNNSIYEMYKKGDKSSKEIGELFGLKGSAIRMVIINMKKEKAYETEAEIHKERMKEEKLGL